MGAAGHLLIVSLQVACIWAALQAAVCAGRLAPVVGPPVEAPTSSPADSLRFGAAHGGSHRQESGGEAPAHHRPHEHQQQHDRSITGVEVILGGLATAALAIVFCYIRVTRRRKGAQEETISTKVVPHQSPAAAQLPPETQASKA